MWTRRFGKHGDELTAARQEGDVHALDWPSDPRGGEQSENYRLARLEDLVEDDCTAMSDPGGAPVRERTIEEWRERDRPAETG